VTNILILGLLGVGIWTLTLAKLLWCGLPVLESVLISTLFTGTLLGAMAELSQSK
jgi:hypothetical protein